MANNYRGVTGNVPYASRIVSVVLLVVFFATALYFGSVQMATGVLFVNLFALPCIWWPDFMAAIGRGIRTVELPPSFVWFFGWVVFLLPLIFVGILWAAGVRLLN
jgi:hypothetical protein